MRKTDEELNSLKEELGVKDFMSWSRYNCYKNSKYEYFLKYILKLKGDNEEGMYTLQGSGIHQIIEDMYEGKIKYSDMIGKYESLLFDLDMMGVKYNKVDEDLNLKIAKNYEESIKHFFLNHNKIKENLYIEKFITIKIDKWYFQGYMDATFKKDGIYHILDWKSSTIYTGEKLEKELGQLKLYALGLIQKGVSVDNIVIGWNFLKYINITYIQKNGKEKTISVLRSENIIEQKSIYANIKSWLKDFNYDDSLIEKCVEENSFNSLPEEIRNKYKINDCYVWTKIEECDIINFEKELINTLYEIEDKTNKYLETKDDKLFWDDITSKNEYYMWNLCGYSRKLHKPFDEYLENMEMFINDIN